MNKLRQWWLARIRRKRLAQFDANVFRAQFRGVMFLLEEAVQSGEECKAAALAMEHFGRRYWQHMMQAVER